MKRAVIGICLVLVVAGAALITVRAQDATTSQQKPPRWRFHWYPVGQNPLGMCFDGSNIWTANFGDGTVSKVRASDGKLLGTFKAGSGPFGVTFDGTNTWVSSDGDGTIIKLRASDGKNLGTFNVGPAPGWMAFDGATYG